MARHLLGLTSLRFIKPNARLGEFAVQRAILRTAILVLGTVIVGGSDVTAFARKEVAPFIAGTQPHLRPEGVPVVREFDKSADWYDDALQGVEPPYPYSLKFLEDQGPWYTPFDQPGMTGPYDIRGLHRR